MSCNLQILPLIAVALASVAAHGSGAGDHAADAKDNPSKPDRASPWLGVWLEPAAQPVAEKLGIAKGSGLAVKAVADDSPAAVAGMKTDDIIIRIGDQVLWTPDQFACIIRSHEPGDRIELHLVRADEITKVAADVAARPNAIFLHGREIDCKEARKAMAGGIDGKGHRGGRRIPAAPAREAYRSGENFGQTAASKSGPAGDADPENRGDAVEQIRRAESAHVMIRDDQGMIHIHPADGRTILRAHDRDGNLVFEGAYETDEERSAVPKEIRKRAERFQHMNRNIERFFEPIDDVRKNEAGQ